MAYDEVWTHGGADIIGGPESERTADGEEKKETPLFFFFFFSLHVCVERERERKIRLAVRSAGGVFKAKKRPSPSLSLFYFSSNCLGILERSANFHTPKCNGEVKEREKRNKKLLISQEEEEVEIG